MDTLNGQLVLVNPKLTYDPDLRAGQIGIITGAQLRKDEITVRFADGQKCLYATDALLLPRSQQEFSQRIKDSFMQLEAEDFVFLMEVDDRLQNPTVLSVSEALDMISGHPIALDKGTISLDEHIRRMEDLGRDAPKQDTGRGR